MSNREIIIGTRGSRLALVQTQIVINKLLKYNPYLKTKVQVIKTSGDHGCLATLGAFVGEIEQALLEKKIDIAIHSLKDMPAIGTDGLSFAAILKRADAREVLILKKETPFDPQKTYTIGTGSPRRELLLKYYFPGTKVIPIRGNVDTRIAVVDSGELDGIILAAAGLIRIGMSRRISKYLPINEFIPPAGQGAVAVQTRTDDNEMIEIVKPLDDKNTRQCTDVEHIILSEISGGCSIPLGAYAEKQQDNMTKLTAFYGYNKNSQINFMSTILGPDDAQGRAKEIAYFLKKNYSE